MTATAPSLSKTLKSDCCTGCGLCATLSDGAVQMKMSPDGFLRPEQSRSIDPETDDLIAKTCPGMRLSQTSKQGHDHTLWGPIVHVRTGASTDSALRHQASSGGAISALLLYLLESGTVDYVVHTSASKTDPLENMTVSSTDRGDLFRAAGSRYAPSAPLSDLLTHLERPGKFALVGKPCDIAAVRMLAEHDPRINDKIPVMLSFYCAGIPSIKGAHAILDELGVKKSDVSSFRYRDDGWPGNATATMEDGRKIGMSYAASWGNILSKRIQFRCKICPDGSGGSADIVCADAWHCDEKGYPLFDEDEGRSLLISRTTVGETLIDQAKAAGFLSIDALNGVEIADMQPSQARRKQLVLVRLAAMAVMGRRPPKYSGYNLFKAARNEGIWQNLKNFLGMIRRLGTGK